MVTPGILIIAGIWLYLVNKGGFAMFFALTVGLLLTVVAPFAFFTYLGFPMWPWIIVLIVGIGGGALINRL